MCDISTLARINTPNYSINANKSEGHYIGYNSYLIFVI